MATALQVVDAPGLARYEQACQALAEAKSVDEVRNILNPAEAMRAYAKQAKNKQLEIDAAEIRIRAERRLGELMAAQRETVGLNAGAAAGGEKEGPRGLYINPRDERPTLAEAGIDKNLADRARKLAAIPEEKFEGMVSGWRGRVEEENERVTVNLLKEGDKHIRGTFGAGENEWYTPAEYIERARRAMGGIDLDPASSEYANQTVRAERFYSIDDDGLALDWTGRIWLNPPYSRDDVSRFAEKAVEEWRAGRMAAGIVLVNNYTDTGWFHLLARAATAACYTRGRIRFVSPRGEADSPIQGNTFFYFGSEAERFLAEFSDCGICYLEVAA